MFAAYVFDLDRLGSSRLLLLTFLVLGFIAGALFWVGVVGAVMQVVGLIVRHGIRAGFLLWQRLLSRASWPVFLVLVAVVLAVGLTGGQTVPVLPLVCGAALLCSGIAACLAYVAIDLERYEVARGYKAIHNPLPGQAPADNLVRYGGQVGLPLLAAAAVSVVVGFALLNQGLYETVSPDWYRLGEGKERPDFTDFLAYTLINLFGVVDLLHLASSYNFVHASFVHQARWPASTLLTLFKSFFTLVLLQQIFASVRRGQLLSETIADFWSPHPPIQERARGALPQYGPGAVWPLLQSLRTVPALTAEQRAYLPRILADVGPAAVPALTRHLGDANENVRAVAAGALGLLHALDAVPHLAPLAHDPSEWVRQVLAEALGAVAGPGGKAVRRRLLRRVFGRTGGWLRGRLLRLRARPAAPPDPVAIAVSVLRELLADAAAAVRAQAAASLGQLGPLATPAVPDLVALLGDADERVRHQGAEALGRLGPPAVAAVPALVALLADPGSAVRAAVAQALGCMKDGAAEAVPALTALLQDADEKVRAAAADALGRVGTLDEGTVRELTRGLESGDTLVRAQTAEALGNVGAAAAEAAPVLAAALTDANDHVRARAAEALGQMGEAAAEAVPQLVRALRDPDTWVSVLAAEALGEIGTGAGDAVPALVRSLRHANAQVRANAAEALGKLGAAARPAVPALVKCSADAEDEVRAQAITALGELGESGPEAGQALLAAVEDVSPGVRAAAVEALGKGEDRDSRVCAALLRTAADVSDEVKARAARALPRVAGPTPAVLDALGTLLREGSPSVQAEAAQALGQLGPEAGPAGEELLRLTREGEEAVREQALRALVLVQPPQAAEAFLAGLKDARPEVRMVASAGFLKAAEVAAGAAPALAVALSDPEPRVRANAARALSRLKDLPTEVVGPLAACTDDPDEGVRLSTALALRAAAPGTAAAPFRQLLADPAGRVRLVAAGSLLKVDPADTEGAAALGDLLSDPSPRVRRSAVELIESLGPNGRPFLERLRLRAGAEVEPELSGLLAEVIESVERTTAGVVESEAVESVPRSLPAG